MSVKQTGTNRLQLKQIAWALSYRQSLERFQEEMPCQIRYSAVLDSNDANTLQRFDIIEEEPAMGRRKTYKLAEWVQALFEACDWHTNFGQDALYKLHTNRELLADLSDEPQSYEVGDANTLAGMKDPEGLVEYCDGKWKASDKLQKLQAITEEINDRATIRASA